MAGLPERLAEARLAILGLGLMGGSLALALRGKCAALLGVDVEADTLALACLRGMFDHVGLNPTEILPQADIIVYAAPVRTIIQQIGELPGLHPAPALVFDLGSTKLQVTQAMERLPGAFAAVGGHPMCGKEQGGLANASAELFQGAPFALVATSHTTPLARNLAEQIVQAVGARPLWLDAAAHDRWVASTSHLPHLLASALADATPLEASPLVGPGFRSTARLAASPPAMRLDILTTNRQNILEALQALRARLDQLEEALSEADFEVLLGLLEQGAEQYALLCKPSQDEG